MSELRQLQSRLIGGRRRVLWYNKSVVSRHELGGLLWGPDPHAIVPLRSAGKALTQRARRFATERDGICGEFKYKSHWIWLIG